MSEPEDTIVAGTTTGDQSAEPLLLAGRYELKGLLGVGGMGRVYRVFDRELQDMVALKLIRQEMLDSDTALTRFRKEVKLARQVTHRNVARIFDIGEHEHERFLTMELVEGASLADVLAQRGKLATGEAVALLRGTCEGVAAAHAVGVVHRDLKPGNIMVTPEGRAVVTDFGLARRTDPGADDVTHGAVAGTPQYMAPEQVEARHDLDARVDVYALGLIAFEMLAGRPAWSGRSAVLLAAARLFEAPPNVAEALPDIPPELAALIQRCLERDRDARPADAAEIGAALANLEGPRPATDSVGTPVSRARETKVAVYEFRELGGQVDEELAAGLGEDLLDALGRIHGVRVRPGGDLPRGEDPVEAGRRMGVDVVVVGSIRQAGDALRVSARLVEVRDGFLLWSDRFSRKVEGMLRLHDEVAQAVAVALASKSPATRDTPTDPRAVELYLRARHRRAQTFMDTRHEAERIIDQALELAPDDPVLVGQWVSEQLSITFFNGFGVPDEVDARVREMLRHHPESGHAWAALALLESWGHGNRPAAVIANRRALQHSPGLADVHAALGAYLLEAGALDDAERHLTRALWADSALPWARVSLMILHFSRGDRARAMEIYEERDDARWKAQGGVLLHRQALVRRQPLEERPPRPRDPLQQTMVDLQDEILAGTATMEEVNAGFARILSRTQRPSRGFRLVSQFHAEMLAVLGAMDEAAKVTAAAVEDGLIDMPWLEADLLAPLRERPAYAEWHATMKSRADQVLAAYRAPL